MAVSEVCKMYISKLVGLFYPSYSLLICELQQIDEWNTLVNRGREVRRYKGCEDLSDKP